MRLVDRRQKSLITLLISNKNGGDKSENKRNNDLQQTQQQFLTSGQFWGSLELEKVRHIKVKDILQPSFTHPFEFCAVYSVFVMYRGLECRKS